MIKECKIACNKECRFDTTSITISETRGGRVSQGHIWLHGVARCNVRNSTCACACTEAKLRR